MYFSCTLRILIFETILLVQTARNIIFLFHLKNVNGKLALLAKSDMLNMSIRLFGSSGREGISYGQFLISKHA